MKLTPPLTALTQQSLDPIEPLDPILTVAIIMSGPLLLGVMVWVAIKWLDLESVCHYGTDCHRRSPGISADLPIIHRVPRRDKRYSYRAGLVD